MTLETGILVAACFFGISGLGFSFFFHRSSKQNRELLEFLGRQIEELQESLTGSKGKLETSIERISEQSRRIAWLETRIRQPKLLKEEVLEEEVFNNPPKLNMTERRYRVLTLASRGQNADKIAATLGMMSGEVELILNLNRVAA